jgi:pyruvate dehydrogenase E2 component (dihydrolipoamide acetyltransferase)
MATRIVLPKQGLQMTEGTIVSWLKKPGDAVSQGEALVEIETDKTTMQVESPVDGVVLAILCREGETVPVATPIAFVGESGENLPAESIPEAGEKQRSAPADTTAARDTPSAAGPGTAVAAAPAAVAPASLPDSPLRIFASPRARAAAEQRHVDLRAICGSGPYNLIIERDVIEASAVSAAPTEPARPAEGVLVPLSGMRKTIARRMKESLAASAQASHEMDIDCSEMVRLRANLKQGGVDISYMDIVVKAVALALRQHPAMNSTWTDDGILMRSQVNIGVAVALDDGLLVPVIRGGDTSSLSSIHARAQDVIARARNGTLLPEDMDGAGFTVTNLGMYGIDRFTAIIDQPQTGILAMGRIVQKPVVVDQAVQIRPLVSMTLSYDHRVIDGAPAARFLQTVRQLLENPCLMM